MGEDKPNPESRMQALIAPLIVSMVVLALVLAVFFMGRDHPQTPEPESPPPEPVVAAPAPAPVKPLTRRSLIERANIAAASAADGAIYAEGASIVGRQFAMRIPFGCGGIIPAEQASKGGEDAQLYARYDAKKRAISLVATPIVWDDFPRGVASAETNPVEHIEGFWIPDPWSFAETCPVAMHQPNAPAADDQDKADLQSQDESTAISPARTLGFSQIFRTDDSRLPRRNQRPYRFVINMPKGDDSALQQTYSLALEGRIASFDGGAPILCDAAKGARPVCYYAVKIDRVAFENQDGAMLAEWRE